MKHFKDKRIAADIAQNGNEATIKSMLIVVLAVILLGAMIPYVVMKEYDTEFDRKYKGKR